MPPDPAQAEPHLKAELLDAADLDRTLDRLARQIVEHLDEDAEPAERLALIGLQTRDVTLAQRLHAKIEAVEGLRLPFGVLDATMYRDDVRRRRVSDLPSVRPTDVPFSLDDRHVVLVDDVVYTGRTIRAALDALMDLGRPASVRFLALVDRGLRELPVRPDFVGRTVPTTSGEEIRVLLSETDGRDAVLLVERPDRGPA